MSIGNIVTNVQEGRKHIQSCVDFMKIVTNIHDGAAPGKILTGLLQLLCRYGKSIPYLGVILASVEGILPDEDSKDVPRMLQSLSEDIKAVRKELLKEIKLEEVRLQYRKIFITIETGMKFLVKISMSNNDERTRHEKRLKDFCSNQTMTRAVEELLDLLIPEDDLLQTDILESVYLVTRGHRGKVDAICIQFLQLFCGGLSVIAAYESLEYGEKGALDMKNWFEDDTGKLKTRFEDYRQRCKDCFKENMIEDLNEILGSERSNKEAAAHLKKFLGEKYDWLETYSIVYKKNIFIDYNFSGDYVESLERNDKFGVIFYRDRLEGPALRNLTTPVPRAGRINQVRQLIRETDRECWFSDAARINGVLKANLNRNGFGLWGCATVKAKRIISIPVINIFAVIGSTKALDSFEISGAWTKAVSDVGGHKHLCLLK